MLRFGRLNSVVTKMNSNDKLFLILLFIINFISALSVTIRFNDALSWFCIFILNAALTYGEYLVCYFFPVRIRRFLRFILFFISVILLTIDWGCRFIFQKVITIEVIDIIAETNISEILSFCSTYLVEFLIGIVIAVFLSILFFYISRYLSKLKFLVPGILISALCGMLYITYAGYNLIMYRNGMAVTMYSTLTRTFYNILVSHKHASENLKVLDTCLNVKASRITEGESPNIIVVIGESYSCFHTPLYGYPLNTNPLLMERMNQNELVVFEDAVTTCDYTHGAMEAIFSLSRRGDSFYSSSLFPACFKKAGFYTSLYDNQYLVNKERMFLTNIEISKIMFDKRNNAMTTYDGELIENIDIQKGNSLTIVHLTGQHYTYSERYPDGFGSFTLDNYDAKRYSRGQREIIATYDNATLYNDYIINSLIRKYESTNSILIYFSDHGEEVYECRNYIGHGSAAHSPNLKYQIKVPFLIWISDKFKDCYPNKVQAIMDARSLPITTDDVSHFLLDLADIQTGELDYTRSFINEKYKIPNSRIVLNSTSYEERCSEISQ